MFVNNLKKPHLQVVNLLYLLLGRPIKFLRHTYIPLDSKILPFANYYTKRLVLKILN